MSRPSTVAMVSPELASVPVPRTKEGMYATMNASTTRTRLHWSHTLWRRILSSMVIGAPSETVMVRQDLQERQANAADPCVIFAVARTTYLESSDQRLQFSSSSVSERVRRSQTRIENAPSR